MTNSSLPFHSPLRPTTAGGLPAYPLDRPLAALPRLTVEPTASGFRLSLWLLTDHHTAAEFTKYVPGPEALGVVAESYCLDPEGTMRSTFHWPGLCLTKKQEKPALTLSDLGL